MWTKLPRIATEVVKWLPVAYRNKWIRFQWEHRSSNGSQLLAENMFITVNVVYFIPMEFVHGRNTIVFSVFTPNENISSYKNYNSNYNNKVEQIKIRIRKWEKIKIKFELLNYTQN